MTTNSQAKTDLSALSAFPPPCHHHLLNTYDNIFNVRVYITEVLKRVNGVTENLSPSLFTMLSGGLRSSNMF